MGTAGSARCRQAWPRPAEQPTRTISNEISEQWARQGERKKKKDDQGAPVPYAKCLSRRRGGGEGIHKCITTADHRRKASSNDLLKYSVRDIILKLNIDLYVRNRWGNDKQLSCHLVKWLMGVKKKQLNISSRY